MAQRTTILALITLFLMGCAATPVYKGVAVASDAGYALGFAVDEALRVVEVAPKSAALTAGVEVGDTLVSLTWILSEVPEEIPTTQISVTAATDVTPNAPKLPPPGVETKTVAFTEADEIRQLISYGTPLRIHLIRQGQILDLTIIPTPLEETATTSSTSF